LSVINFHREIEPTQIRYNIKLFTLYTCFTPVIILAALDYVGFPILTLSAITQAMDWMQLPVSAKGDILRMPKL
jgi:hypothetical protein